MSALRSTAKAVAERALVWSGAAGLSRRRMAGRSLILAYHNIVPDDMPAFGDTVNHLPLSAFRAHLETLRRTHDIVPLQDVWTPSTSGRPRAAITFDDAYRGAVIHGVRALVELGLPGVVFTAPGRLGDQTFWWDAFARPDGSGLDPSLRDRALGELRGVEDAVRAWADGQGIRPCDVPAVARSATVEELASAAVQPGLQLGSHSWSHPNLARLNTDELGTEMARPLQWLRERFTNVLPWVAYPYGAFSSDVSRAAAAAGYESGLAITAGWITSPVTDRYSLPRMNIPRGVSLQGFVLRGAGLVLD